MTKKHKKETTNLKKQCSILKKKLSESTKDKRVRDMLQ
jgi:hypothetical protein